MLGASIIVTSASWIDPLIVMQRPSLSLIIFFKASFVWQEDCSSSFLWICICLEYCLSSPHFELYVSLERKWFC